MDVIKLDDYTIQVTEQPETPPPIIRTYDYDFLLSQSNRIQSNIVNMQLELNKVNELLAQAEALGVISRPTQPEEM